MPLPHLPRTPRQIVLSLAAAALLAAGLSLILGVVRLWTQLPALDRVLHYQPRQPLQVFTADGVPIAQFGDENREFVPIEQIPRLLQQAVIAVEDRRFALHPGIDPVGIARALWANLDGELREGGSTITQQVARNFFLSRDRTLDRKLREALLALRIEHELDKPRILELYMNQIDLGQRSHGFAAAARTYFGKPLSALTLAETAMLAGLPQNPAWANPIVNPERAQQRQRQVLQRMERDGLITAEQRAEAQAQVLSIRRPTQAEVHAGHLADMARRWVVARLGESVYAQGYRIYTTVTAAEQIAAHAALRRSLLTQERTRPWRGPEGHEDLPASARGGALDRIATLALRDRQDDDDLRLAVVTAVQDDAVEARLADGHPIMIDRAGLQRLREAPPGTPGLTRGAVIRVERRSRTDPAGDDPAPQEPAFWSLAQWPQVDGALVALDPTDGRVRALVGGFDHVRSPLDRATAVWRPAGSALQPFLDSAALEQGVMPDSLISDVPLPGEEVQPTPTGATGATAPRVLTLRQAQLIDARHAAAQRLMHTGVDLTRDWLERFGFDRDRLPSDASLAAGRAGTTPMQLARAYSVLARDGGEPVAPNFVDRVTDARGVVIYRPPALPPGDPEQRVVPARNVFLLGTMLQDHLQQGAAVPVRERLPRADLFARAGRTEQSDGWFAGYQRQVVTVAWIGSPAGLPPDAGALDASVLARQTWIDFMQAALRQTEIALPGEVPEGLVRVGADWRYGEQALDASPRRIGPPEPEPLPALLPEGAGLMVTRY
ncbi:MAG: hypothetical protein RLZZ592_1126 [Pseudomonadota bacterium]